jgi:hypothetical protein
VHLRGWYSSFIVGLGCSGAKGELLASASDDFTLYLWDPTYDKKPIVRMTGIVRLLLFPLAVVVGS